MPADNDRALRGQSLDSVWPLGPGLRDALARRFANRPAPAFATQLHSHAGQPALVSLRAYQPRQRPPTRVRLRFSEPADPHARPARLVFGPDRRLKTADSELWPRLSEAEQTRIAATAAQRLERVVEDQRLRLAGHSFRARFDRLDVRFPFPPLAGHPMGIDNAGRDVFARILYALRISLNFGFILVAATFAIGILIGAVQGYFGGRFDITSQRLIEIWSALPFLYVIILMGSVFGRSFGLLLFIYAIFNWISISYYMRAEF